MLQNPGFFFFFFSFQAILAAKAFLYIEFAIFNQTLLVVMAFKSNPSLLLSNYIAMFLNCSFKPLLNSKFS